jgi:hypothetical protein
MDTKTKTITLSNGYTISGPAVNEDRAKRVAKEINNEMKSVYHEFITQGSESRAMDERDEVVYGYRPILSSLGYRIDE